MSQFIEYLWNIFDPAVHIYQGGRVMRPKVPLWRRIIFGTGTGDGK